jgi:hypothetical protein
MQIAQIAPLTEAIPPKLDGGTERVISWLADELSPVKTTRFVIRPTLRTA